MSPYLLGFLFTHLTIHQATTASTHIEFNLTEPEPGCTEGQRFLDSVSFLNCRQDILTRLHLMGIWITRSLQPNFQAPPRAVSVCDFMELLHSSCLPLYSNCTVEQDGVRDMWIRQAVCDTEIYGSPGEILDCPRTGQTLEQEELSDVRSMVGLNYWRQDSRNCRYLLHYYSGEYNDNLDKILRCDGSCDPDSTLPNPFPLFQEEKAYINAKMNLSKVAYKNCLGDVGLTLPYRVMTDLSNATSENSEDVKWSTCASLKTYVRNCTAALDTCLERENAEVVIAQDFSKMVGLILTGIEQNVNKEPLFVDFNHTDCDIFGGRVSEGIHLAPSVQQLVMVMYLALIIHWKVFK